MRNLFVTLMAALLTVAIALPMQAEEVLLPCSDCNKTENAAVLPVLPQGETADIQPFLEDHTWGGDPDDPNDGSWLDLLMCLAYWSPECDVYFHQTIWCD